MKKFLDFLGIILLIGGIIGLIACSIFAIIFSFQNPDMTRMRMFLETPGLQFKALISAIVYYSGYAILRRD